MPAAPEESPILAARGDWFGVVQKAAGRTRRFPFLYCFSAISPRPYGFGGRRRHYSNAGRDDGVVAWRRSLNGGFAMSQTIPTASSIFSA